MKLIQLLSEIRIIPPKKTQIDIYTDTGGDHDSSMFVQNLNKALSGDPNYYTDTLHLHPLLEEKTYDLKAVIQGVGVSTKLVLTTFKAVNMNDPSLNVLKPAIFRSQEGFEWLLEFSKKNNIPTDIKKTEDNTFGGMLILKATLNYQNILKHIYVNNVSYRQYIKTI
jgi:hypothetical protein